MQRLEIARDQWVRFMDGFSRQHEGWLVQVEATGSGVNKKQEAHDLPLQGIAVNLKHGDDDTVEIILGDKKDEYISHNLSGVKQIILLKNDQGMDMGLEINGSDGKATVQFRNPAPPETVDDVNVSRR